MFSSTSRYCYRENGINLLPFLFPRTCLVPCLKDPWYFQFSMFKNKLLKLIVWGKYGILFILSIFKVVKIQQNMDLNNFQIYFYYFSNLIIIRTVSLY